MFQASEQEKVQQFSPLANAIIVIPTYNAERYIGRLKRAFDEEGIDSAQILIIDSSSTDGTTRLVREAGFQLKIIPNESFGHGKTRQMAVTMLPHTDFLVFMTQDAVPCGGSSILDLLKAFDDPLVGAAYGRQLARPEAGPIERHGRLFNYPSLSAVRTLEDRERIGIRAAFASNSFAAYRRKALCEINGFPEDAIVSEETIVVARMLLDGWKSAYQAGATVYHSHPLTVWSEFSRYFDIGVQHARQRWLLDVFGSAKNEGMKFLRSEFRYLRRVMPTSLLVACIRTAGKMFAYQLGRHEQMLPFTMKRAISAQSNFWERERRAATDYSSKHEAHPTPPPM